VVHLKYSLYRILAFAKALYNKREVIYVKKDAQAMEIPAEPNYNSKKEQV
jgi:hypothetical protein